MRLIDDWKVSLNSPRFRCIANCAGGGAGAKKGYLNINAPAWAVDKFMQIAIWRDD